MLLQVAEKCTTLHLLLLTLDDRIWAVVLLSWLIYNLVILRCDLLWENRRLLISKFSAFWFILFLLAIFFFFNILIFLIGHFE